jgi:hypothetical protein
MKDKHFIIYYKQGTGTYVVTEPLPWSRENQQYFQNYDFINNHPNTVTVEQFLINNYGFVQNNYPNVTVLVNLNPNIGL